LHISGGFSPLAALPLLTIVPAMARRGALPASKSHAEIYATIF
jgi:hypothetical protein